MIRRFVSGSTSLHHLRAVVKSVNSLREVVSETTTNGVVPHRIVRLGEKLDRATPVVKLYKKRSIRTLSSLVTGVNSYTRLLRCLNEAVRPRATSRLNGNSIVTPKIGTRLSRLEQVSHRKGSCLLSLRRERTREAKVSSLGVNFGGIFKCCLRIHGAFGSVIPRR